MGSEKYVAGVDYEMIFTWPSTSTDSISIHSDGLDCGQR
jgi:hypothetical protein